MGAWIEIYFDIIHPPNYNVAPLVGAWIEILIRLHNSSKPFTSLLSWERGLKYRISLFEVKTKKSLLSRERGLKY